MSKFVLFAITISLLFPLSSVYGHGFGIDTIRSVDVQGKKISISVELPMIFEQTGIGTDASFVNAIIIGLTNLVFTIVAIAFVDKLGRKPLLSFGLLGIIISMFVLSGSFKSAVYDLNSDAMIELEQHEHFEDFKNLAYFRVSQEKWSFMSHFIKYRSNRPHVNSSTVNLLTEQYFWSSIPKCHHLVSV